MDSKPPSRSAPSAFVIALLIAAVLGWVRLKCGGPSDAELAIQAAQQRNEAMGKSLILPPPAKP